MHRTLCFVAALLCLSLHADGQLAPGPVIEQGAAVAVAPDAPEKSEALRSSKDRDFILHNFKTMYVDAGRAEYFSNADLKAALANNKNFESLKIRVVDDPRLADVVLSVSYTFAWDYPFQLKHQNSSTVLLAGKGVGPFSGPAGAISTAGQFVKLAKKYRTP